MRFDEMYNHFLREVTDMATDGGNAESQARRDKADQEREMKKTEREMRQTEKEADKKQKEDDEKEEQEGETTKTIDTKDIASIEIKLKK